MEQSLRDRVFLISTYLVEFLFKNFQKFCKQFKPFKSENNVIKHFLLNATAKSTSVNDE